VELVKQYEPITGEDLGEHLGLVRGTIRHDLTILTMIGVLVAKPKVGYLFNEMILEKSIDELFTIPVEEIKSVPVVIEEMSSIYDAAVTMFLEDVGTLFIVEDNYLKGIVSRRDLLKVTITGNSALTLPVSVIMTRLPQIIYCNNNDIFLDAVKKMVEYHIDCLPIVSEEGTDKLRVIGRISKTNICQYILDLGMSGKGLL
jgi:CBS domain-containing protein